MGPPASKKRPQMSITTGAVKSQGEGRATAPTQAEGTRLSAPSDSFEEPTQAEGTRLSAPNDSFEAMVVGKPDMDTGAAQDVRRQAAGRHSEELKQAAMSRQQDDQEAQRAVDACVFPAPLPGARGGPEGWNQLPFEHVNKRLLRWWDQHPRAGVGTPSPANFLRAFFAARPGAEGVSLFDLLREPLRRTRQTRDGHCSGAQRCQRGAAGWFSRDAPSFLVVLSARGHGREWPGYTWVAFLSTPQA